MKIKESGVYAMPMSQYLADPCEQPSLTAGIAHTLIRRSPMHAKLSHQRLNPNYRSEDREDFDFGSACHALLLEGEDRMVKVEADDWRTKIAKEQRDAARANGKYPILARKYERVLRMRDVAVKAIAHCPELQGLTLKDAKVEEVIVWQEGAAFCRGRPDAYWPKINACFNYKTTTDATPYVFSRQISRMGYEFDDAFYRRGLGKVFGEDPAHYFMAQESEEPFACSFHGIAPSLREIADRDVQRAITTWQWCMKEDRWPGYDPRVHWAEAASWQMTEHMEGMEQEQNGIPYDPAVLYQGIKDAS